MNKKPEKAAGEKGIQKSARIPAVPRHGISKQAVMPPLHSLRHVPRYSTVSKHTSYAGLPAVVRIAAAPIICGEIRFCQQAGKTKKKEMNRRFISF